MKSGILIFNGILLVLIGILFYLHFSSTPGGKAKAAGVKTDSNNAAAAPADFKIAYFEMDSLEASFSMVKDVKDELSRKEDAVTSELRRMEKSYQDKLGRYQAQAATMTQVQSESATKDMMQMQQQMQNRKNALDQEYQDFYMRKMKEVKTKIEDYLKTYNAQKGYSYILAYEPGLFYYRDSAFDITADLIKGLNESYNTKK
ncbi:MAG: OmpH family outer membrane protein [Chitinophagaceae bacterium]